MTGREIATYSTSNMGSKAGGEQAVGADAEGEVSNQTANVRLDRVGAWSPCKPQ